MEEAEQLPTIETTEVEEQQIQINPPKSKTQKKKEIAKQKWLDDKQKRKERQKLKKKENQEKKRLEREADPEKYARPPKSEDGSEHLTSKKIKLDYKRLVNEGQPIIIDCSFQDKLNDKERISLCRQITYSHAANKKVPKPVKLMVTTCTGQLREQLVKMGGENWGIHLLDKHYLDYYPKDKLVYLTGDATEDITELQHDTAYIIGGLVDHNRYKFATLNKAKEEGLQVKRLPISQHIDLKSSTILSVNHVFDIMVKVSNGEDWGTAIKTSIPDRKREGPPKSHKDGEEEKKEEESASEDSNEDQEKNEEPQHQTDQTDNQTEPQPAVVGEEINNQTMNTEETGNNPGDNEKTA